MRAPARGDDGFIIVAVLWILAALAAFAGVFAYYAATTAVSARVSSDRLQAEALVVSALELVALQAQGRGENDWRSVGDFSFELGGGRAKVEFRNEAARIDLNAAPKPLLVGLFAALGAKPDDAESYADRVIGWRKKGQVANQDKEGDLYKDAGAGYLPREAPFQSLAELPFVLNLPPDIVAAALPYVTVFSGGPHVDVLAAEPMVIQALPNLSPDAAAAVLDQRGAAPMKALQSLLGRAAENVATEPGKTMRVKVDARVSSGRRIRAEAVILLADKDADPYKILFWRDDFDGAL
ncbi:general secretion pathway protein GspK [Methylocella sp.]|uniref:general secretion pathway protein GspK n=1 Tax=Methylocella sp. TaxID=1978226 RepID=UPI003782EBBF